MGRRPAAQSHQRLHAGLEVVRDAAEPAGEPHQRCYGLTLFKIHFGNLTLKAYTKGEHVLRFEALGRRRDRRRWGTPVG